MLCDDQTCYCNGNQSLLSFFFFFFLKKNFTGLWVTWQEQLIQNDDWRGWFDWKKASTNNTYLDIEENQKIKEINVWISTTYVMIIISLKTFHQRERLWEIITWANNKRTHENQEMG